MKRKHSSTRTLAGTSILLLALAMVFAVAATVAWFSIADTTRVYSMTMDVTTGNSLRFDTVAHEEFGDYKKTLSFNEIAESILRTQGYDPREVPLTPVTTRDCETFTFENGTVVERESGCYMEFVLHFIAAKDMFVHLTSENSEGGQDGTRIGSQNPQMPQAMRISFSAQESTSIYDPGRAAGGEKRPELGVNGKVFGLPSADRMVYNDENGLFSLKANQDLPVVVRIWLEGTDEACTDDLKGGDYTIRMRFEGTDEENNRFPQ